ncbi:MAG: glutamate synthase large chain, partial [Solirubrobacterales bacterium]|nr:glutamate synthase large chain [Solirubrobacterales bacterium]
MSTDFARSSRGHEGRDTARAHEPFRYSPELPWKPRVAPPSVEDKDACAIYASVRKDGTPNRAPVTLALANLQKMLHRAGNVDGEGDGCGILVDIPRRIWSEEVRASGHNPALALDPAFAVAHVFVDRKSDLERLRHDAREILGNGGFRILAERIGAVDSHALGPTAREEEPHFWQIGGLVADSGKVERILFELMLELEGKLDVHMPSFSATTCVYKVMGAPKVLGAYYPDLR